MNIFFLSENPSECARFTCDKHCVKMILETAQILSTAHWHHGTWTDGMYKPTHKNHPSVLWAALNPTTYWWTYLLFKHLSKEYTERYNKEHKSWKKLKDILMYTPDPLLKKNPEWTNPPQCMPEKYRQENTVQAYRDYYMGEKYSFAKWEYCDTPDWWDKQ